MKCRAFAAAVLFLILINNAVYAADNKIDGLTYYNNVYVTRVYIGPEITEISEDAFVNLHRLFLISVDESNPNYSSYANCLYNKDKTKLLCMPFALSYTEIPDSVVEMSHYALRGKCAHVRRQVEKIIKRNKGE